MSQNKFFVTSNLSKSFLTLFFTLFFYLFLSTNKQNIAAAESPDSDKSLGIVNKDGQNSNAEITKDNSDSDQKLTIDKIDQSNFAGTAVLQGLNKVTAKTSELQVKVGGSTTFGKLIIKVHKCWKSPADQRPENKILLQIDEIDVTTNNKKQIFYGWMFSSSPSISGLEHPVYDITAISCKK